MLDYVKYFNHSFIDSMYQIFALKHLIYLHIC